MSTQVITIVSLTQGLGNWNLGWVGHSQRGSHMVWVVVLSIVIGLLNDVLVLTHGLGRLYLAVAVQAHVWCFGLRGLASMGGRREEGQAHEERSMTAESHMSRPRLCGPFRMMSHFVNSRFNQFFRRMVFREWMRGENELNNRRLPACHIVWHSVELYGLWIIPLYVYWIIFLCLCVSLDPKKVLQSPQSFLVFRGKRSLYWALYRGSDYFLFCIRFRAMHIILDIYLQF